MRLAKCDRCGTVVSGWVSVEVSRKVGDIDVTTFGDTLSVDLCDGCDRAFREFMKARR